MADTDALMDLVLGDVVEATKLGRSVLVQAADQGHGDVLRYLLQRINDRDPDRSSSTAQPDLGKALSAAFPGATEQGTSHSSSSALLESCASFLNSDGLKNAKNEVLDEALLSALRQWDPSQPRTSPHTQSLERLHAQGALLPDSTPEADKAKHRLFIQDIGSRALVADRTNEAIEGPALKKRKGGQREE